MRAKLLFLFLLLYFFSNAQNDSVKTKQFEKHTANAYKHIYTNQDSAYLFFNKALKLTEEQNWHDSKASILSYIIYVSDYHYNLPVLKHNLNNLEQLLVKNKDSLTPNSYNNLLPLFLLNKANYYFKLEDYKRAKPLFLELYKSLKAKTDSKENITNLSSVYSFLTNIYTSEGKYNSAINFHDKAAILLNKHPHFFEDIESRKMLLKSYMAKIYNSQKQYRKGISLLEEIVEFYKQKNYKNSLITSYQALINSYILSNNTEKALILLSNSEKIYRKNDPFYKILLELYGDVYAKKEDHLKAINYYQESLTLFKNYRNHEKHIDIALIEKKIAESYFNSKQNEKSLTHINLSINNLTLLESKIKDITTNNILTNDKTIEILHLKSKILTKIYTSNNDLEYLKEALQTSLLSIEILDVIKPTLENKNDKQFLINNVYPIFETALNECFLLFNQTQDNSLLSKAFYILEKSKSTQLLEVLNLTKAVKFNNIPQQLIDKEQQLLDDISKIETDIYTSETSSEKQKELITAREIYNSFLDSIKITQPKYHNLKYNYEVISLDNVTQKISETEGNLSFLYGKNHVYQLAITKNKIELLRFESTNSFKKKLIDFYQTVSNFKSKYDNKKAYQLFNTLIPEVLKNKTNITILPDGFLHYIPFEALSISSSKTKYAIESFAISYGNSFTLLDQMNQIEYDDIQKKKILAVAPEFYNTKNTNERADFSPLIFNKKEVQNIANYFKTDTIIGKKATLKNIEKDLAHYQVLHFATHASANDEYPDFSYLAFTPTKNESNLWYIKDIYNTKLNADLVALSACQTGIGKLENGEGSISLARAFTYAGAKSLVKSLWKVNDKSSAEIMSSFYNKLNDGKNKKQALQYAKKDYLEKSIKELKHPFFWAGFVINGNTEPIANSYNFYWILYVVLPLLLLVLARKKLFYFFK
ncbi:CHAT domain-containing protein [Tenacibaculum sp. ZS6-P6]|uniref:CHAT domain-containing protein n=1 Tax=Tenacibaculum sp. ZS6-P6 TaxID=3447503 RepID=UPI003F9C7BB8